MSGPDDTMEPDDGPEVGYEREAALVRSLADHPVQYADAPDSVWAAIAEEVAGEAAGEEGPSGGPSVVPDAGPVVLESRRRRTGWIVAAAAAVVIALVVGVFAATSSSDDPSQVATAQLQPLEGVDVGNATAEVSLENEDGTSRLDITMNDLPPPADGTFYELWLLSDDGAPGSVAAMHDPASHVSTTVPVPAGTDTARYRTVDVSVQHDGAGPAHSGESILRGTLTA